MQTQSCWSVIYFRLSFVCHFANIAQCLTALIYHVYCFVHASCTHQEVFCLALGCTILAWKVYLYEMLHNFGDFDKHE